MIFLFMRLIELFNDDNVADSESENYRHRIATRGVVFDENDKIALLYSRKFGWYEIPGGGVEDGEGLEDSFLREIKEEVGCDVDMVDMIGKTIEIREDDRLVNETICFIAKVVGEKGRPVFQGNEIKYGFEVLWVSMEEAERLIESTNYVESSFRKYFKRRALAILKEAKK